MKQKHLQHSTALPVLPAMPAMPDSLPPGRSDIAAAAALAGRISAVEQSVLAAQEHWNAGQNHEAEALCHRALGQSPGYPPALHLLGLIAHTVGKLAQAVELMRGACVSALAPALYHSNFAELCRQAGRLEEAEQAARRAVALLPSDAAALSTLGIVLQERGQLQESLGLLRQACAMEPDNAEFHNNLANTLQCCGLLLEARQAYAAAIERNPDYDVALANLARLLGDLGEAEQGLQAAAQAVELNPQCAAAYLHAAAIHFRRRQLPQAAKRLQALLSFMPDHPQALQMQAELMSEEHEDEHAEALARRALELDPRSGDAALALAKVLQSKDRLDEALAIYAQDIPARYAGRHAAAIAHASLLIELGRTAQARAILQRILAAEPQCARAWLLSSSMERFSADGGELESMQAALDQGVQQGQSFEDRIALHFALGKGWMDAGDIGLALDHYEQANALQRSLIDYDVTASTAWMQEICRQVPAQLLQTISAAAAGEPSDMPVFIVGMPRSGTTLVEQILASHPDIHGAGELRTVQAMIDSIVGRDQRPLPYPQMMHVLEAQDFTELGAYYLDSVRALAGGKRHVVDKMPLNFLYLGLIHAMLPNARIIHLRRDPLDTCMSCYCQPFSADQKFTFDLAELGEFHGGYLNVMEHWRSCLPASRLLEIDYESLVADVESGARRLIDFCSLPWDDACLAFHTTERRVRTASMAQVRQPIHKHSIGRWQKHEHRLAPVLDALQAAHGMSGEQACE